jgi:hypothetical protein
MTTARHISLESLREISVEDHHDHSSHSEILVKEINADIKQIERELEALMDILQQYPELLPAQRKQLENIERHIVQAHVNNIQTRAVLEQSHRLKKIQRRLKILLAGCGMGVVGGGVTGSVIPGVGTLIGSGLGLVGGGMAGLILGDHLAFNFPRAELLKLARLK